MLKSAAVLALLPLAAWALNCTGKPDGNYEIGCRVYTTCTGGQATVTECDEGTVYNSETGQCNDPTMVKPPCGQFKECTNLANGHYPDQDNGCHSYYTCLDGAFMGHNFCPDGLVFNEQHSICDWPSNVLAPCGTHSNTAP